MGLIQIDELILEDGTLQTWSGAGCYGITFLDQAENVICSECATQAVASDNDWLTKDDLKGGFIYWEGAPLSCSECSAVIESEYGDPAGSEVE